MTAGRKNTSSLSQQWCTPPNYAKAVREFFCGTIELDPCSNEHSIVNAKVEYRLPTADGLNSEWNYATVFVNPPYGADRKRGTTIRDWLRKCADAHVKHGAEVLALVPVAANTRHWKLYVWGAATGVAFLYDTRLPFLVDGRNGGKGAPMACAMVYWGIEYKRFEKIFLRFGATVHVRHLHDKDVGTQDQKSLFGNGKGLKASRLSQ